jgi:hypothetical protein
LSKRYSLSLVTFFINVIVVAFHDFTEEVLGIKDTQQSSQ